MSDHLRERRPRDRSRIDLDEGYEMRYWTRRFSCSVEELCTIAGKVGNSTSAVRRALGKRDKTLH